MSVTVDWCSSHIIHVNFENHWDWQEFSTGMQQAYTLMSKSAKTVNLMVDFVGSIKHVSTSALANIIDKVETPPNQGITVIVTEDALLGDKLSHILGQTNPNAAMIAVVSNGEEAINLIRNSVRV
ncbi:MAG: hypothetical protein Q9P01_21850 [Anaerolineae bacterium]|nr:hypothetical protein [Anaerolineae bacterium]